MASGVTMRAVLRRSFGRGSTLLALTACALLSPIGCSSSDTPGADGGDPTATHDGSAAISDGSVPHGDGGLPAGWLYTSGGSILTSNGAGGGTPWISRGVNVDDLFFCGYNNTLQMAGAEQTIESIISGVLSKWKPSFFRISLSMGSYPTMPSWTANPAQYKTPMTNIINTIGAQPNTYVLVTLRSEGSMIGQDTTDGDAEATGIPSDHTNTPNATLYPTGTDATYVALVDTFANSSFVLFGLTNEPGGNKRSNAQIGAAMDHAVGVIRAEEDRLGVPHHLVAVQGNGWTSDISFYAASPSPITHDNVIYEVHGYPPTTKSYTYPTLPVIIGEYGTLTTATAPAFFADLEAKKIPNLAWDFDPYNDCAPDLVEVDHSAANLKPSAWGSIVQSYRLAHAGP